MKKILFLTALSISCFTAQKASADLLAAWDFAGLPATTTTTFTPDTTTATVGAGAIDLSAFGLGTPQGTAPERTSFGGSTLNAFPGGEVVAGQALALASSTANGKSAIFSLSLLGYESLEVSFATRGTGTGFNMHLWSWSTDGITFTPLAGNNTAVTTSTFEVKTVDFSVASGLNNAVTAYLMLTVSGATSTSGNNRFENIQFNAEPLTVPEPSVGAILGGFGLLVMLMAARRR